MLFIKLTTCSAAINNSRLRDIFDSKAEYLAYQLSQFENRGIEAAVAFQGVENSGHLSTNTSVACLHPVFKQELETFLVAYEDGVRA